MSLKPYTIFNSAPALDAPNNANGRGAILPNPYFVFDLLVLFTYLIAHMRRSESVTELTISTTSSLTDENL